MSLSIPPEKMANYKQGARERFEREQAEMRRRREAAWLVAHRAAALLRSKFGAQRVLAYGSLTQGDRFGAASDIDLAVAGIAAGDFWRAWAALDYIESAFEIDLISFEFASPRLLSEIARDGVDV